MADSKDRGERRPSTGRAVSYAERPTGRRLAARGKSVSGTHGPGTPTSIRQGFIATTPADAGNGAGTGSW